VKHLRGEDVVPSVPPSTPGAAAVSQG
jgi:hypothetical protein